MLLFSLKTNSVLFHEKESKMQDTAPTKNMQYIALTLLKWFGNIIFPVKNKNGPIWATWDVTVSIAGSRQPSGNDCTIIGSSHQIPKYLLK